jgi:hypothetical protein
MPNVRLRTTDSPDRRFHLVYGDALLAAFGSKRAAQEAATLLEEFPLGQLLAPNAPFDVRTATIRLAKAAGALATFWCNHQRELAADSPNHHRIYRALLEEFSAAGACARGSIRPTRPLAA